MKWRAIRKTLDNRSFSSLYVWVLLVPILANSTKHLPSTIAIPTAEETIRLNTNLPFSWVALYFAGVFLYSGWVLYSWLCPEFIQSFKDPSDAIARGETAQSIRGYSAKYIGSLKGFSSKHEKELAIQLASTWRALPSGYDTKLATLHVSNSSQENCQKIALYVEECVVNEDVDKIGYYKMPPSATGREIKIEKSQFVKHVCRDLENICDIGQPMIRLAITILIAVSAVLILCVMFQGFLSVLQAA